MAVAMASPSRAVADDTGPIRIGLLPTIPTLSLLRLYDPLRVHLQMALGRPVELYTSPNFRAFVNDIRAEQWDMLVAAPHFGVVAVDLGYVALYRYLLELRPVIIVPKGSPIRDARQLAGKRIFTADRLAALSVVAQTWLLSDYGMSAGRDYQLVEASNHSTAIRAVAIGDADAAISGRSPLQQVSADIRDKVEAFDCRLVVPHQFILVHPRLGGEVIERVRAALEIFPKTPNGEAFLAASGFKSLIRKSPLGREMG